ncbi:MAG TPA: APC family permease [Bryobacteraceae bacterium]|nr:APC family permease [Bryobacteraceae bacterium]
MVLFNIAAVAGIRWLAAAAHAGPGSVSLWVLAAVFFFVPSALAVATLSHRYPDEGGIYVWTKRGYGEWHGFLCGWCYWLSNLFYFPNLLLAGVSMAGYSMGFGESKPFVFGLSLAILWIALAANVVGLGVGRWVNSGGGVATYAAGVLIVVAGFLAWSRTGPATPIHVLPEWDWGKINFWSQIAFAFGGLELGAVMGGEIRDPARTLPRAAWISGLAIAAFYILGTLALVTLVPSGEISVITGLVQAGEAAGLRAGLPWLGWLLIGLILLGVAGQLGAWIGGSARLPFVIGLDRYLPPAFARLHPRFRTPWISILAQGGACTVFLLVLQAGSSLQTAYQLLVDMTVITYFIPFLYLFGVAWKHGRRWSAISGLAVTAMAMVFSAIPPAGAGPAWLFELKLAGGCAFLIGAARIVFIAARTRA